MNRQEHTANFFVEPKMESTMECTWCELGGNRIYLSPIICFILSMDTPLPPLTPSTLYLVATPIGNLEDITLRALRVLRECDVVAAEDTRRSGQLLKHFEISKPLLSYFQFNEAKRSEEIIERLRRGEKVALVTDAGSPGISDPGERVVKAAIAAGFRVEAVAGPCALVAGLTASGLPTDEFHFVGFLPHKSGQRRNQLEALKTVPGTLVFYESPYRIEKLLGELSAVYPDRDVVLARELSKKFEEFLRAKPAALLEIAQKRSLKGEFVVLVAPSARLKKTESMADTGGGQI
jgi:16S rRNA (cytidine1402-2'-O)-methyltransferase